LKKDGYHGISIFPFRYDYHRKPFNEFNEKIKDEMRRKYGWYYGWDVASTCIWNPDSIIDIEQIKTDDFIEEFKKTNKNKEEDIKRKEECKKQIKTKKKI